MIFNDRVANVAERYLKKGGKVYVEGSLQTRKWTDQGGQERYTTEIVIGRFNGQLTMLDGRSGGGNWAGMPRREVRAGYGRLAPGPGTGHGRGTSGCGRAQCAAGAPSWDAPKGGDLDDEIPF